MYIVYIRRTKIYEIMFLLLSLIHFIAIAGRSFLYNPAFYNELPRVLGDLPACIYFDVYTYISLSDIYI